MCINPFLAGVFATVCAEVLLILTWVVKESIKRNE